MHVAEEHGIILTVRTADQQLPRWRSQASSCLPCTHFSQASALSVQSSKVSSQYPGVGAVWRLSRSRRIAKSVALRLDLAIQPEQGVTSAPTFW